MEGTRRSRVEEDGPPRAVSSFFTDSSRDCNNDFERGFAERDCSPARAPRFGADEARRSRQLRQRWLAVGIVGVVEAGDRHQLLQDNVVQTNVTAALGFGLIGEVATVG